VRQNVPIVQLLFLCPLPYDAALVNILDSVCGSSCHSEVRSSTQLLTIPNQYNFLLLSSIEAFYRLKSTRNEHIKHLYRNRQHAANFFASYTCEK
jgi:hypothetical protein